MENLIIFLILIIVLGFWVLSFSLIQKRRLKSGNVLTRAKGQAYQGSSSTAYHNKHLTEDYSSFFEIGGSNDSGIFEKVNREKKKGAYKND